MKCFLKMRLDELGEFGLIERLRKKVKLFSKDAIVGIGDDAAVLKYDKNNFMILTTDMLVEDVHFSLEYFKPEQIGMKAVEQNVSDIAAMCGTPKYALVSLAIPKNTDVSFIERLYDGINKSSRKYKISIVGGNISSSKKIIVDVAMAGFVRKKNLALRRNAKKGDLIFCSGNVGKSACGLELLRKNKKGVSAKYHLEPKSRLDLSGKLSQIGINAVIDVSDGVAPEILHLCKKSKVGARVFIEKIPISKSTISDAKKIGKKPFELALYGGEDFELIFTAPKNNLEKLKDLDCKAIGEIVSKKDGIKFFKNGKLVRLRRGFEHFRNEFVKERHLDIGESVAFEVFKKVDLKPLLGRGKHLKLDA